LVYKYFEIWKVSIDGAWKTPAKVPPSKLVLKPDAKPMINRRRNKQKKVQRDFLKIMTEKLVEYGLIEQAYDSTWCSASLVVKKPGKTGILPEDYRWTVDLRHLNSQTARLAGVMPVFEVLLDYLSDLGPTPCFCSLDCPKG